MEKLLQSWFNDNFQQTQLMQTQRRQKNEKNVENSKIQKYALGGQPFTQKKTQKLLQNDIKIHSK